LIEDRAPLFFCVAKKPLIAAFFVRFFWVGYSIRAL